MPSALWYLPLSLPHPHHIPSWISGTLSLLDTSVKVGVMVNKDFGGGPQLSPGVTFCLRAQLRVPWGLGLAQTGPLGEHEVK